MIVRTIVSSLAFAGLALMPASAQTVRVAHPQLGIIISDKDGTTVGEVADVLRAAADREQVKLIFVPMSGSTAQTLESGAADAVAPLLATPEGLQHYDFTETLVTSGGGLFVRAPNPAPSDLQSLAGKTVVTPSWGPFVGYIEKNFPNVRVVGVSSYQECLDRVLAGNADAAALNIQEGASVVSESYAGRISEPQAPFLRESLVLGVLKGRHADFIGRINAGLAAIRADGTLQRIFQEWSKSEAAP